MILAFSTRHGWLLVSNALIFGILAGFLGHYDLPIPIPGFSPVLPSLPMSAVYAVFLVVISFWCVEQGEKNWMKTAVLPVRLHSWGLFILASLLSIATALGAAFMADDIASGLLFARNVLSFGVVSLFIWQLGFSLLASVIPALWVAFCCLFARDSAGELHWWAWAINRFPSDLWSWGTVAIVLTLLLWRYRLSR